MTVKEFFENKFGAKIATNLCPFKRKCVDCPWEDDKNCTDHFWLADMWDSKMTERLENGDF